MTLTSRIRSLFGGGSVAFKDAIEGSIDRANVRFIIPPDSAHYISARSREAVNEKVEWLWQSFGVVKEGVAGIARHTVGKGISLQIDSDDDDFNSAGEDDFETYALTAERCDLSGRRTFYEAQTTALEQRVFRGEFFSAKTENPEWGNEPCFQLFDGNEIRTPSKFEAGSTIIDGVELNQNSRALRYFVRNLDGETSTPVERARMIHW